MQLPKHAKQVMAAAAAATVQEAPERQTFSHDLFMQALATFIITNDQACLLLAFSLYLLTWLALTSRST